MSSEFQNPNPASDLVSSISIEEADPLANNYGDIQFHDLESIQFTSEDWTKVETLTEHFKDKTVLIRGNAEKIRSKGKKIVFLVVCDGLCTVQCVLNVAEGFVSPNMVKFANGLPQDSLVDIEGIVSIPPNKRLTGTTQQVEIQVRKLYCLIRAITQFPFEIKDAARSEAEIELAEKSGEKLPRVNQDTRLNYRVRDLCTPANQGIFTIKDEVENFFGKFLRSESFRGIHTPKIIAGSSEGGSAVFKLDYFGKPACLAQSPQLHKQMSICGGFGRVFEIGTVSRAEESNTVRHLCEFTGLDVEMYITKNYAEVMDIVDRLFVNMFDYLYKNCSKELEAINKQYPFEKLEYPRECYSQ